MTTSGAVPAFRTRYTSTTSSPGMRAAASSGRATRGAAATGLVTSFVRARGNATNTCAASTHARRRAAANGLTCDVTRKSRRMGECVIVQSSGGVRPRRDNVRASRARASKGTGTRDTIVCQSPPGPKPEALSSSSVVMSLMRSLLLAASAEPLAARACADARVRPARRRALHAGRRAGRHAARGRGARAARVFGAVLTRLGENVTGPAEADAVARHYLEALDRVAALGLAARALGQADAARARPRRGRCHAHLRALAERAHARGNYLWIDMEQSRYVDATLDLTRARCARCPDVGVCLQAYLLRTPRRPGGP